MEKILKRFREDDKILISKIQECIKISIQIIDNKIKYDGFTVKKVFKDLMYYRDLFISSNHSIDTVKHANLQNNLNWCFHEMIKKFYPKKDMYEINDVTPFGSVLDVFKNQYFIDGEWYNKRIFDDFFKKFKENTYFKKLNKRFKESEVTNEINIIYNYILNHFRDFKFNNDKEFLIYEIPRFISGLKIISGLINQPRNLTLFVMPKSNRTQGGYGNNRIYLYIENFNLNTRDKRDILDVIKNLKSTIIHELTHAWDDYKSKGNYQDQDKYLSSDNDIKSYLNQQVEINARYTSILDKIDINRYFLNFESFKNIFQSNFPGYTYMSKDQEKRILQRLLKDYNMPLKSQQYNYNMIRLSQRYIYSIMNDTNDFREALKTARIKSSESEIRRFTKESFEKIIHNNASRNEIKNPIIIQNRFKALEIVYGKYNNYLLLHEKGQESYAIKYLNKIDLFKRYLNISDNEFDRFIDTYRKIGIK